MSASSCYIASCQICPYPFLALRLCVLSFSAAQWNQLCVCLRYLVNLLRENRLPTAAPSHHSHLLCLTIVIAERSARLLDIRTHGLRREVVFSRGSFVRVGVLEGRFRPISLEPCLVCVDSTCVHLLVYLLQESRLPAGEQSHYISPVRPTVIGGHRLSGRLVFQPEEIQQCCWTWNYAK